MLRADEKDTTSDGKTEAELEAHSREMFRRAREEIAALVVELDAAVPL